MKTLRDSSGYTLLEMLVTVGLLAIIGAMAMPVASEYRNQFAMQSATDRLGAEIGRARMQAVSQNVLMRIRFDGVSYVRERSADGVTFVADGVPVALPPGVSASFEGMGGPTFDGTGLAPESTVITLQNGAVTKTIYTNVLGRVNIS
jgi:prepilin-type N-terminal cleavage/methylation domain-containing protein